MEGYIGIDVAKAKLDVALLCGEQVQHASFDNTPKGFAQLDRWLKRRCQGAMQACLEATGQYGEAVAEFLYRGGYAVSVVNPAQIKAYAASLLKRNKTDKSDAYLIARYCQHETPPLWTPAPPELVELRSLVRHLEAVQAMRQQEHNRLHAGHTPLSVQQQLTAHLAFLDAQIAQLHQLIQDHIDRHPHLRQQRDLLISIPGIGDLTASKLLAELPPLHTLRRAKQLVAYAGLSPKHHTSGSSIHRPTRISKQGNAALRTALYFPAIVAQRYNPIVRALVERLRARGHCKMSALVAAMRKLLHLVFGILKSGQPFDPHYLDRRVAVA